MNPIDPRTQWRKRSGIAENGTFEGRTFKRLSEGFESALKTPLEKPGLENADHDSVNKRLELQKSVVA